MSAKNFSDLWGGRGVFGANNPFVEMQRDFNRMFGDAFRRSAPRVDVRETDAEVCVVADLPGVTPADLDVRLDGATLTLAAERHGESEKTDENYHVMERSRGLMRRTISLPFAPDPEQVHANYENGVLTVRMPKAGKQQRGRRIDVHGAGPGASTARSGAAQAGASHSGASGNVGVGSGAGASASEAGTPGVSPGYSGSSSTSGGAGGYGPGRTTPGAAASPFSGSPRSTESSTDTRPSQSNDESGPREGVA